MKKIEIIVKPHKLEDVKEALAEIGIQGLTVTEVRDFGHQEKQTEIYRGNKYIVEFAPNVKIETVVEDAQVEGIVHAALAAAKFGETGDGQVFTMPVDEVVRIRTGETGVVALR